MFFFLSFLDSYGKDSWLFPQGKHVPVIHDISNIAADEWTTKGTYGLIQYRDAIWLV